MVANSSFLYQTARIFMMGMYTTAAPIPITNLPINIRLKSLDVAEYALSIEPNAIRKTNVVAAFLGPILSVSIPLGICINVYA